MSKELEEAIKELRILNLLGLGCSITEEIQQKFKIILNYLDNSIPKEVVEKKIEKYKQLELESFNKDSIQADEYRAIITALQELLEGK